VYRAKSCTRVFLAGNFLFVPSGLHTLAVGYIVWSQNAPKKLVNENANVSFLRLRPVHWFVACYVLLLTEIVGRLWSVTLEWIEFGCVHKLYPEESDYVPANSRPI